MASKSTEKVTLRFLISGRNRKGFYNHAGMKLMSMTPKALGALQEKEEKGKEGKEKRGKGSVCVVVWGVLFQ